MDLAAIVTAIDGLRMSADIVKTLQGVRDANTAEEIRTKLQSQISDALSAAIDAKAALFELQEEKRQLEEQIRAMNDWSQQKARYALHERAPGVRAYAVKTSMQGGEGVHWICPDCYESARRSILQEEEVYVDRAARLRIFCPHCRYQVHTHRGQKPATPLPE